MPPPNIPPPCPDLCTNLVGYWTFDNTLDDASPTGAHGVWSNGNGQGPTSATYVAGAGASFGNAVDLERGSYEYIALPSEDSFDPYDGSSAAISFSVWIRPESFYFCCVTLISKGDYSNDWRVQGSGTLGFYGFSGGAATSTTFSTAGTWYHLAGTGSTPGEMKIYVNGVLEATAATTAAASSQANSKSLFVGGNPDHLGSTVRTWDGRIDDLAVWKRTLSASEVLDIYTAGAAGNPASTLGLSPACSCAD